MSFLEIQSVSKHYGSVAALDDVTLNVPAGSRTAIVGPSGSGKTTLLRLIAGFEMPDAGRVSLGGALQAEPGFMLPAHKRGIGIVSQDGALFPHLSVADNIAFGFERGLNDRDERIKSLAEMVELDPVMLARRPHQLSGGQQQRVALARALGRQPRLMLLDEPFSALDTGLREAMRKAVSKLLASAGITTILVTHDQTEALSFADQLAVLRDGRLVQSGAPKDLYERPIDRQTALFLGEAIILPAEFSHDKVQCALGSLTICEAGTGLGDVMVRPEQISVVSSAQEGSCAARVLDVEFSGASGTVTLQLTQASSTVAPLSVRMSRLNLPVPGDVVYLSVNGEVHRLPTP
ncbi:ABC transporter ATP-binding protein [Allorhizobium taibaishanense]|uniref:Iron(III) transport system ATP-binding protein n=1 Tax=Allorhizobium taibaishanense TaxID=887144 RepID=A0A1Q9A9M8_9HYPH|nr:ABC transporter ATP-binding protein [Allorhizobium taibaishanense]MBB4009963.1 iron(III) transport system ATP-binding protein [Allorhizobium taibaishanense]OLP51580.1 sugar ABC transporter [Allorhizobium taibaishanense]